MVIVLIGPPGSGKGTQAARLVEHLDLVHLSTGEMLREAIDAGTQLGEVAKEKVDRGQLVPDPLVIGIVAERLNKPDCDDGFLFDGFPRNQNQAQQLDTLLDDRGTPLDVAISIEVDQQELRDRMLRRAETEHRTDDNRLTMEARFDVFEHETRPVIDYYRQQGILAAIDGHGTPDEVFERIQEAEVAGVAEPRQNRYPFSSTIRSSASSATRSGGRVLW